MPEEVLLHLDVDHLPDVFLVELLDVSNLLIRIVVDWLLRRNLLAVVRIERVRLTRLPEDALEVVLEVLHFEFVYRVTVLILEGSLVLLATTHSLHSHFNWEFLLV